MKIGSCRNYLCFEGFCHKEGSKVAAGEENEVESILVFKVREIIACLYASGKDPIEREGDGEEERGSMASAVFLRR
jgi:hypothetical protein